VTPGGAQVLQRAYGNRAVTSLLRCSSSQLSIQAKLTVNPAGDQYEVEADRVAGQVIGRLDGGEHGVQRETEDGDALQIAGHRRGTDVAPALEDQIQQARGRGSSLPGAVRVPMEEAFGTDLRGVRVHTDARSDKLNKSLQARAFTTGSDIFFRQGEYNPASASGRQLLAHELTHVVQQGGVSGSPGSKVQTAPFPSAHSGDTIADNKMAITVIVEDAPPRPGHAMMDFEWYSRYERRPTHYASHLRAERGTNFFQRIGFGKGAKGIVEQLKDVDVTEMIAKAQWKVDHTTGKARAKAVKALEAAWALRDAGLDRVSKFTEMETLGGKKFVKKQYLANKRGGIRALQYVRAQVGQDRTFNFLLPVRGGKTNCITFVQEALNKAGLDFDSQAYVMTFLSPRAGIAMGKIVKGRRSPLSQLKHLFKSFFGASPALA
jgi:hypothetical protein